MNNLPKCRQCDDHLRKEVRNCPRPVKDSEPELSRESRNGSCQDCDDNRISEKEKIRRGCRNCDASDVGSEKCSQFEGFDIPESEKEESRRSSSPYSQGRQCADSTKSESDKDKRRRSSSRYSQDDEGAVYELKPGQKGVVKRCQRGCCYVLVPLIPIPRKTSEELPNSLTCQNLPMCTRKPQMAACCTETKYQSRRTSYEEC